MKWFLPSVVAAVLAACGGSNSGNGALDPGFSGTWVGPVVVTSSGVQVASYIGQLVIAASGNTATVADICLNGAGTLSAQGSGESASWSGTMTCPPFASTTCAAVTQTFTSVTAILTNGMLSGNGTGTVSGCGQSYDAVFTFTGTKQ